MQGGLRGACGTLATARRRSHIDGVVTISISAAALDAIEATLPENREADPPPRREGCLFRYIAS